MSHHIFPLEEVVRDTDESEHRCCRRMSR